MSASGVFVLVDGRKNTTSASCTVSRPSWAQVYRSETQQPNAGSTRARFALRRCPCASCIWLLHPAPILMPKMVCSSYAKERHHSAILICTPIKVIHHVPHPTPPQYIKQETGRRRWEHQPEPIQYIATCTHNIIDTH